MHVLHVVGARPNFMKAAPVMQALKKLGSRQTLVHTGQHYDANMSDAFFLQLEMPAPDVNLNVGSGSHSWQTAEIMLRLEPVVQDRKPDITLVYGDVNSTLGAALTCAKLRVPVGHVEAGLRSYDRSMPEEMNRVLTDQISEYLFTPSEDADRNLQREGVPAERIHRVGNVMIDSLVRYLPLAMERKIDHLPARYALVTLHRPSNVEQPERLQQIMRCLLEISKEIEVVFPVHPRTKQRIKDFEFDSSRLHLLEPLPYIEFLGLQNRAVVVITDSGGIQEETTYLKVPCITLRENTERPVTVTLGTNILVGNDLVRLHKEVAKVLAGEKKSGTVPPLWDGHAAERIAENLLAHEKEIASTVVRA